MRKTLRCGTPQARPACDVHFRYLAYVDRARAQPFAFAEMALGYALIKADPRFAGINIVDPEDDPTALADYAAHMQMFRFFSAREPNVLKTLHAGELTLGLVPPADLRFHIAEAVAVGARRIGHGVDIAYEDDAPAIMARMAREGIAVEINLSSNDDILGVRGREHPLNLYRAAGVPVVLATDDEGVSRIDMTNEYLRAAVEHGLRYPDLKRIARNGLEYAFVPGASLWQGAALDRAVPACAAALAAGATRPDAVCTAYLSGSEKARLQWRLERDLAAFEAHILQARF
jgi:adenosine deaminase